MAIMAILLFLSATMITQTNAIWSYSNSKITQGREARVAFNSIVLRLGQATVNQYYGYTYSSTYPNLPLNYVRRSELRFISGLSTNLIPASTTLPNGTVATANNLPTDAAFFAA